MTAESIKKSNALSVFKDSAVCLVVLTAATLAGYAFKAFHLADADIIMLYIIAVLVISIFTSKIQFCLISSVVGVVLFNYFFTYPEFSLSAHDAGYPVTFVTMFITAFIAGTLANKLKRNTLIAEQMPVKRRRQHFWRRMNSLELICSVPYPMTSEHR